MPLNIKTSVPIALEVFGGLVSEMSPTDVPQGIAADCQDVQFTPGNVATRGGLRSVLTQRLPGSPSINYAKTCVFPDGTKKNLILDSNGVLYAGAVGEDPVATLQVAAGSYAKSVTAFGREYIAISDKLHGAEVPLQYDGTNLDRVTSEGPGAAPTINSLPLPSVDLAVTGAAPALTVTQIFPSGLVSGYNPPPNPDGEGTYYSYYTSMTVDVADIGGTGPGQLVTISGNSNTDFNASWYITSVNGNSFVVSAYFPATEPSGSGGSVAVGSGSTLTRYNNVVSATTTSPHGLLVGYQAQITKMPSSFVGGGISSIVINNEDFPGLALVTTNSAHGLVPGLSVSLAGINPTAIGGGISSIARAGGIVTVHTVSEHGLSPGSSVTISGTTATNPTTTAVTTGGPGGTTVTTPPQSSFNTVAQVASVASDTSFTFAQNDVDAVAGAGGTLVLNWPIPATSTPRYFQVESSPTANTFYVAIDYSDGSWSGGNVSYAWDGTFYVATVPTPTTFSFKQYGPNASSSAIGKVAPYGQVAPGVHQMSVCFLTRNGYVTRPSPVTTFTANGGQYISVTNIPIGPAPTTVARILCFTGAGGQYFYYIPSPAAIAGQIVSTSTQVSDNTTTSVVLDFSDSTLYRALAINTTGNDLPAQQVLEGALGFAHYANRLLTWGQRNTVQNLLNMSFDGGSFAYSPTLPCGWGPFGVQGTGALSSGHFGSGWLINVGNDGQLYGALVQQAYQDSYGAPILQPNTIYKVRVWLKPSQALAGLQFVLVITGPATNLAARFIGSNMSLNGGWMEATMEGPTPSSSVGLNVNIFAFSDTPVTLLVDELSMIYADTPYLDTIIYGSYGDNPEAFDGVSGKFGPADDTHKVMGFGEIRNTLYILTQDPGGRIHEIGNNGVTEPAGWAINEVAANCGLLSAFGLTTGGDKGEEWISWVSKTGARIFGGAEAWKLSQEIEPDWQSINPQAYLTCWAFNDSDARVIYYGLPTGAHTQPDLIYPMDYRELQTAEQIASSGPIHTSNTGKLISTDHVRKWTRWNIPANGAIGYYLSEFERAPVFLAGEGLGQLYLLDSSQTHDDDLGRIYSYYIPYFFVGRDEELAFKLGAGQKDLDYLTAYVYGVGKIQVTPYLNNLARAWPYPLLRTLTPMPPDNDLEWSGALVKSFRMAFKIEAIPITGIDAAFTLSKLCAFMKPSSHTPIRGAS